MKLSQNNHIFEGLHGCRELVSEMLDWLSIERSQDDFDKKYSDKEVSILPNGDTVVTPKISKFYVVYPNDIILGSFSQGLGAESWAGKIHIIQILCARGVVTAEKRNGKVFYKKVNLAKRLK